MNDEVNNPNLLYPELSYSIIGSAMDVHNELGPGWDEWDYHRAMIESLSSKGHVVVSHDRKDLLHRGSAVDHFELDILVDNLVILELKHIKTNFQPNHYTQIINYLKLWEKRLGILINYGLEKLLYNRVPFSPVQGTMQFAGKWVEITEQEKCCTLVAEAVENLLNEHVIGHGVNVFQKLLFAELEYLDLKPCIPCIALCYGELSLGEREIGALLVGSDLMVLTSASEDSTSATDMAYLKSYMKKMSVPYGILINIYNSKIQLRGVL